MRASEHEPSFARYTLIDGAYWPLERDGLSSSRHPALSFCFARDLFRKLVPTFRNHALAFKPFLIPLQASQGACARHSAPYSASGVGLARRDLDLIPILMMTGALSTSWPGLTLQVGLARLAAFNTTPELGQARAPMPSTSLIGFMIQDVDARDKRGHDESNIVSIGISCAPPQHPACIGLAHYKQQDGMDGTAEPSHRARDVDDQHRA